MLSLVRSSVWSRRQELYPHITACLDYASARIIVHFISPQDEGTRGYLEISPTALWYQALSAGHPVTD